MPKKIFLIAAARPNFMKVAPLWRALDARSDAFKLVLVHTGQHYDRNMSDVFFEDLGLPKPDVHLGVGGGSHAEQTAGVMVKFEKLCLQEKPDLVMVVGDVNATMATTVVAAKLHIPVAHVEAGLRSRDMTMPEEINRLMTDVVADLLLTPSPDADENLRNEGVDEARIHLVGNIMIDSLVRSVEKARGLDTYRELGFESGGYGVVLTDSGGLQEETTFLQIPCLTLRPNTERPITIEQGTSELATVESLPGPIARVRAGQWKKGVVPELWDGQTAERIAGVLAAFLAGR